MSLTAGRDCVESRCPFLQLCLIGLLEGEEFHRWHTSRHSIRCKNCGTAWHMREPGVPVLNAVAVIDYKLNGECSKAFSGAYWRDSWLAQCPHCDRGKTHYWLISRTVLSYTGAEATCSGASYARYEPKERQ